jgi:hypothetical protein
MAPPGGWGQGNVVTEGLGLVGGWITLAAVEHRQHLPEM